MPIVPDTFAPSVTQDATPLRPATGPWVSPMRNAAPGALEQAGQTALAAGGAMARLGNTIGDRVQETMDDALTKSAETSFLKSSQDILYNPQSGYLTTRGLNAQTQWDAATQAISKARQDARATLTNPIQQRMFDQVTNDHMLTLGRTMADHQHQQLTQYGIQQGQDRADSMNLLAKSAYLSGRMDDFQKYSDQARSEVLHVAALNGAAPDSDIAQAMLRAKHTDLVHGITTALLDDHKYDQAKQFFEAEQPNIDMRTAEVLNNAVKTEYDRNLIETKGDAFLAAEASSAGGGAKAVPYTYGQLATGSTINPLRITDTHDGYDIAMPAGTQVMAPLDGKVVKVWNDDKFGGGLSMRVQLADGKTLGVAHLSAANLKEGDTVNRGQVIALSGATGNATGNVLHVALQDPDGKYIDYFSASKAQPDPANIASPDVLQRAIDAAKNDASLDPFQQRQVIRYMETQHSHERAIQEQQYQEVKQQAVDYYFSHNYSIDGLPAAIKAQLRPQDLDSFQNQPEKRTNDIQTEYGFVTDPSSLTVANVKTAYAQGKLTDQGLLEWTQRAMRQGDGDQAKVHQVALDTKQFTDILAANQLPELAQPKSDEQKLQRTDLETTVKDEIDVLQQKLNRGLTRDEKAKVMRDLVIDKVYTPGLIFAGNPKPVSLLTPDEMKKATVYVAGQKVRLADIPAQYQQQASRELQTVGAPATQANIAAWWLRKGKPTQ